MADALGADARGADAVKASAARVRGRRAIAPTPTVVAMETSLPVTAEVFADAVMVQMRALFGPSTSDALDAMLGRMERSRQTEIEAAERMGVVTAPGRKALKSLDRYDREKPTKERAGVGVWDVIPAEMFDTSRLDEKMLMDWKARAGGAGEMYARGQIGKRELAAAAALCTLEERSRRSQLSGIPLGERVDGGMVDTNGDRLRAAAKAHGLYRDALESLGKCSRILVENRVVRGRPMEECVRLRGVADRLGDGEKDMRRKCDRAMTLVAEALDVLADELRIREA